MMEMETGLQLKIQQCANNNGDIAICTRGQTANASYTIILELRKDNAHYQRGQFNDPAAFNYGEYSIRP